MQFYAWDKILWIIQPEGARLLRERAALIVRSAAKSRIVPVSVTIPANCGYLSNVGGHLAV